MVQWGIAAPANVLGPGPVELVRATVYVRPAAVGHVSVGLPATGDCSGVTPGAAGGVLSTVTVTVLVAGIAGDVRRP